MMRIFMLLALSGCAASAASKAPLTASELQTYPDARGLPADAQHFIVQWNDCAHFSSEPPWDEERARDLERAVRDVCPGVDQRGADLRRRYVGEPQVLARLADYQPLGY